MECAGGGGVSSDLAVPLLPASGARRDVMQLPDASPGRDTPRPVPQRRRLERSHAHAWREPATCPASPLTRARASSFLVLPLVSSPLEFMPVATTPTSHRLILSHTHYHLARQACIDNWLPRIGRSSYVVDGVQGGDARRCRGGGQGEAAADRGEGYRVRHEPGDLCRVPVEAAPLEQPALHPRILQPARPGQDHRRRRRATARSRGLTLRHLVVHHLACMHGIMPFFIVSVHCPARPVLGGTRAPINRLICSVSLALFVMSL